MCTATITTQTFVDRKSGLRQFRFETLVFAAAMLFVGAVSVYDGYLVIRTGDEITHFEKNPVGLFLIEHNHNDPIDKFFDGLGCGDVAGVGRLDGALPTFAAHRIPGRVRPDALPIGPAGLLGTSLSPTSGCHRTLSKEAAIRPSRRGTCRGQPGAGDERSEPSHNRDRGLRRAWIGALSCQLLSENSALERQSESTIVDVRETGKRGRANSPRDSRLGISPISSRPIRRSSTSH